MKAVVLLSGGLDSATVLYWAIDRGFRPFPVFFSYGQRHGREVDSARRLAAGAGLALREIRLEIPADGSALVDPGKPLPASRGQKERRSIPRTYVPGRNLVFLSLALSWAEDMDARAVMIGANDVDYSGYPDCRPLFYRLLNRLVAVGTKAGVEGRRLEVIAPLLGMSKSAIVGLGARLGVPFEETWSCYAGSGAPCGKCESCFLRARGFREAGLSDPLMEKRA